LGSLLVKWRVPVKGVVDAARGLTAIELLRPVLAWPLARLAVEQEEPTTRVKVPPARMGVPEADVQKLSTEFRGETTATKLSAVGR
jgi:hypothetical protein